MVLVQPLAVWETQVTWEPVEEVVDLAVLPLEQAVARMHQVLVEVEVVL